MLGRLFALVGSVACLAGCGVASVSPFVTDGELIDDPRLVGIWEDSLGRESAAITALGSSKYRVVYTDNDKKTGIFTAHLGRLGALRVLDLEPDEPLPDASDVYRSLILRAHGVVVIDLIGSTLRFRLLAADSVRAYLARSPQLVTHIKVGNEVLLTAASVDVRRFVQDLVRHPGMLGEPEVWRRRRP